MKKYSNLLIVCSISLYANITPMNVINSNSLSSDNGGSKIAIDAYSDGAGVLIVDSMEKTVDNSAMNELVFKYGESAKTNSTTLFNEITILSTTSTPEDKALALKLNNQTTTTPAVSNNCLGGAIGTVISGGLLIVDNTTIKSHLGENLCTSNVTDMTSLFDGYADSNFGNISNWDTSHVTSMQGMFVNAINFNENISNWDTSNVTDMGGMFMYTNFNQPIGGWNVSKVTNFYSMFDGNGAFNQPIGSWNTSSATSMGRMFNAASSFNQPIGTWNVSNVYDMVQTFRTASNFNQDLSGWNTSGASNMNAMFLGASSFNQNLSTWNVQNVWNHNNFSYGTASEGNIAFQPKWK